MNYIAGTWREGSGVTLSSHNPATRALLWQGASASVEDVAEAGVAAAGAFDGWAGLAPEARAEVVERYRAALEREAAAMAETIAKETGKALWDARGEVQAMLGKIPISLRAYAERTGAKADGAARLYHKPHGVAAVFGPYNFPGHLPNGHIVPALLAGNTVVFKPSDYTPLVAETMVALWEEAGLPAGVLNLVQGGRDTGIALAALPQLAALYFTGSAEVGALLHKQFSGRPEIILALEMGGNNPLIVHGVKDIEAAAVLAVQSAFVSTGQRCTCARRLIVPHGGEGDAFIARLAELAGRLRIGAYDESPEPFMGPLVGEREGKKLLEAQDALLARGAKPLLFMQARADNAAFVTPAILDVTEVAQREDREHFGPFLQVIRVRDMDEALTEANRTRYGLAAGLFSDDPATYELFAARIRAGVLAWNRPTTGASSALPFGGVGISGNHRPSAYYAADYCAYPVAAQVSETAAVQGVVPGLVR